MDNMLNPNSIQNSTQEMDSNTLELRNVVCREKITQTAGGDNEFILELRDEEVQKQIDTIRSLEDKIKSLERKVLLLDSMIKPYLTEGSDSELEYKFRILSNINPKYPLRIDPKQ